MSNIPKLRFKEFSGEWEELKIGNQCSLISGQHLGPSEYTLFKDGIPYFSGPSDYTNDSKQLSKWTTFDAKTAIADDILITVKGSGVGELFYLKHERIAIGRQIMAIRAKDSSSLFIFQMLSLKKALFEALASGNMIPGLSRPDILQIKDYFPSISEQQKIASFLSAIDSKIDQLVRKKELIKQYKKGVMQKIFSQELRFKVDDGSEFPEWEEKKLGDVCLIKKGSQLNRDGLDIVGQYAVINGGISPSGYNDEWNTEANTITISEGGNSCGYVSFMTEKFWSGGHCYTLENIKSTVKNEYLFQYLKAYQIQIMRLRVGSGLPNIQKGEISKFIVKIPYINEQNKIASFLSDIDTKIDLVTKQLNVAKNFKKGLLQQMFV